MATFEEQIAAQYAGNNGGLTEIVNTPAVAAVETPAVTVETPAAVAVETPATPPVALETPLVTPPVVDAPKVKSFEDELAEKSNGKYKSWADMQSDLTPKELKFANEKIAKFNELALKGVDVTSREFLEVQSLDVDKIDKADQAIFEKWKRSEEGNGLSNETIMLDIREKYKVDEWENKEESEFTPQDRANREKMSRDAANSKDWLTNYKNERVLEKQVDPAVSEAMAKEREQSLSNWDKIVDTDLVNKITKLSSPISYKDETGKTVESNVDYNISPEDAKYVSDLMKQLPRDSNAFFNQFKDDKGNQNHEALVRMVLRDRGYDKAMAESYSKGAEQRALLIEKTSKNTNFAPSAAGGGEVKILTPQESLNKAIQEQIHKG